MACQFGSEKKYPSDSTITIYPYEGVNAAAQVFMGLALIPSVINFNADEVCSQNPPEYVEIGIEDFANLPSLYEKVINNSKRKAWFQGCQCKAAPPEIPPPPAPPEIPSDSSELPPFVSGCPYDSIGESYYYIQWRGWTTATRESAFVRELTYASNVHPNVQVTRTNADPEIFVVTSDNGTLTVFPAAYSGEIAQDYKIEFCPIGDGEGEEGTPPNYPDPCEGATSCRFTDEDLLKQPDKAEIISELQLWTSESNNRIRDELKTDAYTRFVDLKEFIAANKDELKAQAEGIYDLLGARIQSRYEALDSKITASQNDLQSYIDGAKNQTLTAIAASTAAIGAGIVAATTTITGAIAAATTTVTGAITTATTTITGAINDAKNSITNELKKEIEDYAPRYRRLSIEFATEPTGISVTAGLRDAPNKFALGWIQFYRADSGNKRFYYERQFIINTRQDYVCQEANVDAGYVLHVLPKYSVSATLGWTRKKE